MYQVTERYSENIAKPVRFEGIYGELTLNDGGTAVITDADIRENTLSISKKMNSGGELRAGGAYSAELSVTLQGQGGSAKNINGARLELYYRLYTDSGFSEYDEIPLGIYYVDGSTIKRRADMVSFKANDSMLLFGRDTTETGGTLYQLISAACTECGVPFGMTEEQFSALPNSDITAAVNTSRIQTWHDLLIYVGTVTNSFARISRGGALELVQLTCERNDGGVIIPVREIDGDVRSSTEFSDDTQRVTRLFMMRGGVRIASTVEISETSADHVALEWTENPLLAELTDEEVKSRLNTAVRVLYQCVNRAYKTDISGDPALDVGDYIRLRGGDIDTSRGYGTGMITSQLWKYRGRHTLRCDTPAALSADSDSARTPPKSQTQKQIDELKAGMSGGGSSSGAALTEYEYISDSSVKYNGTTYTVEKNDTGLISRISDDNGNDFKPVISGEISDVTLHNAVFWALAMHSGISRNYYDDTLTPMVQYRYNVGRYTASGTGIELLNQADGAALPLVYEGATLNSDNVYIVGNTSSRGYIDYTGGELNECTTYLVAKGATTNALRFSGAPSTHDSYGVGEGFSSNYGRWCAGTQANATLLSSAVSITSISVLVLRHVGDTLHFYVNGTYIGACPTPAIPVTAGKFWMGITAGMYYDGGGYHYYDFAFAESAHSEVDVIKNSKYLMWKYGVK